MRREDIDVSRSGPRWGVALLTLCLVAAGWGRSAAAEPRYAYVPELVCVVSMTFPAPGLAECTKEVPAGSWHLDLTAAFVEDGAYVMRVDIPDGRYAEVSCSIEAGVAGSTTRCRYVYAGLGSAGGSSSWIVHADAYLHVNLPSPGIVRVFGGDGRGVVVARGVRASLIE